MLSLEIERGGEIVREKFKINISKKGKIKDKREKNWKQKQIQEKSQTSRQCQKPRKGKTNSFKTTQKGKVCIQRMPVMNSLTTHTIPYLSTVCQKFYQLKVTKGQQTPVLFPHSIDYQYQPMPNIWAEETCNYLHRDISTAQ